MENTGEEKIFRNLQQIKKRYFPKSVKRGKELKLKKSPKKFGSIIAEEAIECAIDKLNGL